MMRIFRIFDAFYQIAFQEIAYQFIILPATGAGTHLAVPRPPSHGVIMCPTSVSLALMTMWIAETPHYSLIITVGRELDILWGFFEDQLVQQALCTNLTFLHKL